MNRIGQPKSDKATFERMRLAVPVAKVVGDFTGLTPPFGHEFD
jgi:hypothetical protein